MGVSELFSKKSNDNSDTSGNNVEEEKQKLSEKNKKVIKLEIYNYFKNIKSLIILPEKTLTIRLF